MTTHSSDREEQDYSANIPVVLYEEIYGLTEAVGDTRTDSRKRRNEVLKLIDEAITSERERAYLEGIKAATEPQPTIESIHDFPAKAKDFRPWKNNYGEYKDWSSVPDELFNCTRCGVEWGVAIRKNATKCLPVTENKEKNENV